MRLAVWYILAALLTFASLWMIQWFRGRQALPREELKKMALASAVWPGVWAGVLIGLLWLAGARGCRRIRERTTKP